MLKSQRMRRGARIVAAWGILAAIVACGGGDDDGESSGEGASTNPFSIRPGFTPDPRTAQGEAGGPFEARTRNQACRGYIGAAPDHTLNLEQPFNNLRVLVSAPSDTTLVIQLANGEYRCDDDGGEGMNPLVAGAFPAGRHRIFVGTYARPAAGQAAVNYTIGVTELNSVTATTLGGGAAAPTPTPTPTPTAAPGAPITLAPGFMPDPARASGVAGGAMQLNALSGNAPGCRGSAPAAPQHTFVAQGNFNNLRIMARGANGPGGRPADTTLAIRRPDGTWICNDDAPGENGQNFFPNPMVTGPFPAGTYAIYVGRFGGGAPTAYNLAISELASVNPNTIAN